MDTGHVSQEPISKGVWGSIGIRVRVRGAIKLRVLEAFTLSTLELSWGCGTLVFVGREEHVLC